VDLDEPTLDRLNKQVEVELQERGIAVLSIVNIRGKKHLHAAINNHRSRRDDLYVLVREVIQIGNELAPSAVPGSQSL
jgi:glutamate/tyrosine decarboxylase-like PLP-dependent enzyme